MKVVSDLLDDVAALQAGEQADVNGACAEVGAEQVAADGTGAVAVPVVVTASRTPGRKPVTTRAQ